jgi:hypothetical protein
VSETNLGEYRVVIEADYANFSAQINTVLKTVQDSADQMIAKMSAMSSTVSAGMAQTATTTATASAGITSSVSGMTKVVGESVTSLNTVFEGLKNTLLTIVPAMAVLATFSAVKDATTDYYKEVKQLSNNLGISSQQSSSLNVALEQVGLTTGEYLSASKAMTRQLATNGKGFSELGIETTNANGTFRNSQEILMDVANVLKNTEAGTSRNVAATEIFKRAQIDVTKFSKLSSDALADAAQKAEALGLMIGPKQMANYDAYLQAQRDLKLVFESLSISIGGAVLPVLAKLGEFIVGIPAIINGAISSVNGWIDSHKDLINTIESVMEILGITTGVWAIYKIGIYASAAATAIWSGTTAAATIIMATVTGAIETATIAIMLFKDGEYAAAIATTAMTLRLNLLVGSVVVIGVAIAALATAWYTNFNGIKDATASTADAIAQAFTSLWEHLKSIGAGIFKVLQGSLALDPATVEDGINTVTSGWSGAMNDIGSIASNTWSGVKTAGVLAFEGIANAAKGIMSSVGLGGNGEGSPNNDGNEIGPQAGKEPEEKKGEKPDTEYQIAKRNYEEDISLANYSANDKLYLYRQYLSNVEKEEKEKLDFMKGQHRLENESFKESVKSQSDDLDIQLAKQLISQGEYYSKQTELKKKSLDRYLADEITARKESDSFAGRTIQSDDTYKSSIENTEQYKKQLKDVNDETRKSIDLEKDLAKIREQSAMNHSLSVINASQKSAETSHSQYGISDEQLLAVTAKNAKATYDIKVAELAKELAEAQNDEKKQEEIKAKLLALDDEYAAKKDQINQQVYANANRYQLDFINTYETSIAEAMNNTLNKTKSFADNIRSIFTSLWKTIANQFSQDFATKWTTSLSQLVLGSKQSDDKIKNSKTDLTNGLNQELTKQLNKETQVNNQKTTLNTTSDTAIQTSAAKTTTSVLGDLSQMLTQMLSTMAIMYVISALFGGGGSSSSTSSSSVSLGRSASSYYTTPTAVSQITVPSFDVGAQQLPEDMLAMVHKDEMILEPGLASNIRSLGTSDNSTSNSTNVTVKSNFSPNLIDSRGINQVYKQTTRELSKGVAKAYRNGSLSSKLATT